MTVPVPPPAGYWTPNSAPRFGNTPGRPPANYWAWTGLLVSVSGFLFNLGVNGVLGVIFSVFGLRESRKLAAAGHTETGQSLARAGLIVGIVHIIVTVGLIVGFVFLANWFYEWVATVQSQLEASNLS